MIDALALGRGHLQHPRLDEPGDRLAGHRLGDAGALREVGHPHLRVRPLAGEGRPQADRVVLVPRAVHEVAPVDRRHHEQDDQGRGDREADAAPDGSSAAHRHNSVSDTCDRNTRRKSRHPSTTSRAVVVATAAPVNSARFLELLWPTTTPEWSSRPTAVALDSGAPQNGMTVPLSTGGESFILNTSGATTQAGGLRIEGARTSDLGVVRLDGAGGFSRLMLEAVAGGRLKDQDGARTLLDLGDNSGMLEVAFDGIICMDYFADTLFFSLGEIFHRSGRLNFSRRKDVSCKCRSNAVNIRQCNLHLLFCGYNYPSNSSHA